MNVHTYFLNGMFDYDKQGEKRRKRGATNALNVKEGCGLCQTCKDSHAVGGSIASNNAVNIIIIIIETAFKQLICNLIIDTHRHNAGIL